MTQTRKLLLQIQSRQRLAAIGRSFHMALLVLAGLYALLLIAGRMFSVIPEVFSFWSLALVPALALLIAVIFHRRPTEQDAARAADVAAQSEDLYLTASMLDKSPGAYAPLVIEQAEGNAGRITSSRAAPWTWGRRTGHVTAAMLVLLTGVWFLPQLDPFGVHEARRKEAERKERLAEAVEQTKHKVEALKQTDINAENSKPVEQALAALKQTFNQTKPEDKAGNLRKIQSHQDRLQQQWKSKKLANSLNKQSASQRFGGSQSAKAKQWQKEMAEGNTSSLKKEIQEAKELAEKIQNEEDEAKRQEMQKQLKEKLGELSDFAKQQPNGQGLSDSLKQAMEQLDMSQMEGLDQEALEALSQSLQLSDAELEQMAQNQRDIESLEKALKAMQQAKQLNEAGEMDGSKCEGGNCNSMADYEKLFAEMLKQCQGNGQANGNQPGQGNGGGMGGPGRGKGNIAPEDDTQQTAYQQEKENSQVQAGKILMSWKDKGVSEKGDAGKNYQDQVKRVKQGVSEAIVTEEVPPGYHDSIQKYFDTIDRTSTPADQPQPDSDAAAGAGE